MTKQNNYFVNQISEDKTKKQKRKKENQNQKLLIDLGYLYKVQCITEIVYLL